ncbi:MAG TPA: retropepsin-like aspartic protease [Chlamydiales bacterium]|nr:retropepsin-like aspartic protease [Chlamydiales bacterium]
MGQATPPIKVSAASTKELVEPMYDHRTRAKDQPRPPRGHPTNEVFTVYMPVGGELAYCLLDCGCEGVLVAADYARAVHLPMKRLTKPVTLQLACQGSKSMINHGVVTQTDVAGKITDEYFDVANIDYYDVILGTPFLRRFQVKLDFTGNGEIIIGGNSYKPGGVISPSKALTLET